MNIKRIGLHYCNHCKMNWIKGKNGTCGNCKRKLIECSESTIKDMRTRLIVQ